MKIAIIGYSGSGKSTLAEHLSQHYHLPKLHLDTLQFLPSWQVRASEEFQGLLTNFLDQHDDWVIDGNYTSQLYARRMAEADYIIFLDFPAYLCLSRAFKRYIKYRGRTRTSMATDCPEKFDWAFIKWILWDGRTRDIRANYDKLKQRYPHKFITLKKQAMLDQFLQNISSNII